MKQNIMPQYKICVIRASQKMQLWSPPQNDPQRAMTFIKDMKLK